MADNAPGHKEVTLTNIHVEYMPKNTTSLIQPADAGIIKCFKGYYRNLTVQKCLYMVEEKKAMGLTVLGSDMAKKITVLDAIHMPVEAWGIVKQSTIQNCFKKLKLLQNFFFQFNTSQFHFKSTS